MIATGIFLFVAIFVVWLLGSKIDIMVQFIGAVGANSISWLFPGSLYLLNLYRLKSYNKCKIVCAIIFLIVYFTVLIGGLIALFGSDI